MAYVEKVLMPDERIVFVAVLHWIIYIHGLVMTAVGGLVAMYSAPVLTILFGPRLGQDFSKPVAGIALIIVLVGLFLLGGAYLRQNSTEIVITDKRLIAKYGIVSRTTFEVLINRITGANFDQTVLGRLMGFGTVLVHGAGGEISPIDQISDPQLFYRALMSVLRTR